MTHIYDSLRHDGHPAITAALLTAFAAIAAYITHP